MLNRLMVVVLLGCVGLTAGLAYGTLFSGNELGNELGVTVVLPAKSSYTFPARFVPAPDLVKLMRGYHPGVRVVAHGERVIELSPERLGAKDRWIVCVTARRHCDDYTAHWLAMRKVVRTFLLGESGRRFNVMWHGTAGRLPVGGYVLFGLLAGLSASLGFLVPPRSRVTAVH